jgi:3-methyl-2-oxobutanoate hydroxymethyltransferase
MEKERVTPDQIRARKGQPPPLTLLPAYDATFARFLDRAGIDLILVGDTLGQVIQGHDNPLPVTVEDVVYHLKAVSRVTHQALVVGDMPFLSYQISTEEALRNAGRMIKAGGARAVKLEGGESIAATVAAMTRAGIAVIGHIGVQPQSVLLTGHFRVSAAKALEDVQKLLADAHAIAEAGAFALVLEAVPREVARKVTASIPIPTLGIGAGPDCDGQVLVTHDLLGLFTEFKPRFVKRYANLAEVIDKALAEFLVDIGEGKFPDDEHSYHLKDPTLREAIEKLS